MTRARRTRRVTPLVPSLLALALLTATATAAEPARCIPAEGLAVYAEYDGVAAHSDAWKATAAYAMFARTPAGATTADVVRQVADHLLKALPGAKPTGAELLALQAHVARNGVAVGLYDDGERGASCVVVLNGLGRPDERDRVGRLARLAAVAGSKEGDKGKDIACDHTQGREVCRVQTADADEGWAWWFEKDDLIVVTAMTLPVDKPGPDAPAPTSARVLAVLDAINGKVSTAATHPGRDAAESEGTDVKGFESAGLFFAEAGRVKGLLARLDKLFPPLDTSAKVVELPLAEYIKDDVKLIAPPAVPPTPMPPASPPGGLTRPAIPAAPTIPDKLVEVPSVGPFPRADQAAPPTPAAPAPFPAAPVPVGEPDPVAALPPHLRLLPEVPMLPQGPPPLFPTLDAMAAHGDPDVSKARMIPGRPADGLKKKKDVDVAKVLGLDGITRVVGRWGFQGKALLTAVRVEAPAPRKGVLALFDQKGFRKDNLPPLPTNAGAFLVGSFDAAGAYEALLPLVSKVCDGDDEVRDDLELVVFMATRQRLSDDLLGHFGPTWCLYATPPAKEGGPTPPFPALLVEVDDAKAFGKVLDSMAKRVNAQFRAPEKGDTDEPPTLALERLPDPDRGYRLTSPAGIVSMLGKGQQPTVLVGDTHVAVAADPATARAALAATKGEPWRPSAELAEAFACLPANLTSLTVGDPKDSSWPEMIAYAPKLIQHLVSATEVIEGVPPGASVGSKVLGMLGVPQPGGFRLRLDPAKTPKADDLRAQLFPSVLATAVDDRGVRFVCREAVPFACEGPTFRYNADNKDGEVLTVGLRAFLFPTAHAYITKNLKKEGGRFILGGSAPFAPNAGDDD